MKFPQNIFLCFVLSCVMSVAQNKATHTFTKSKAVASENFQAMTFNGIWSWFSDPRAVYFEGKHKRTYVGWIDNYGDVHIGFYDHETKEIQSQVIYDNLEIDDHDNPSILFDDEGHLMVFFNTHTQDERPLYMRTSQQPEDISQWNPIKELNLNPGVTHDNGSVQSHTYTNPVRLSKEDGKLYIFWRGINMKPSYSVSSDHGETWSKGEIFFQPKELQNIKVPYTKIYSDGISKIHFVLTDGHPAQETKIGLYYMYYENGSFYKANGTKIKPIDQLPVLQSEMDVIYESDTIKSWNWDIAQDRNGNPIVTYAKFPNDETHVYSYATFNNNEWKSYDLVDAGGWFPETRKGTLEAAPHYSGGIVIDHENPNIVYLSVKRKGIFEIEAWTTQNHGKSWKAKKITQNSTKNNVRPFAVRGAKKGNPLQVVWLQNTKYIYYALNTREKTAPISFRDRYHTSVKMDLLKPVLKADLTKENIINVLRQVVEHQLENPQHDVAQTDWQYGVGFAGVEAFYDITKEARYQNELLNIKQYQTEEDEDEDSVVFSNMIWSYSAQNNRNYLQKIEAFSVSDFKYSDIGLDCATMIRTILNFEENMLEIEAFKEKFKLNIKWAIIELENYDTSKVSLQDKAFLIYALAQGIREDLADIKHKDLIIQSWKRLQAELLEKNTISKLDTATSGAILIAGKEILQMINVE
ncbi:BNR-4 repeat-containing protein [Kordia sp. YSTF-M3]|uniref:BNR-4 repeat-containing protein n=1 Tax=Kordia aestuariivivens TaxID=2759037 RepID=A0ABR7QFW0_9FLAO|nr:BNR-4 repeat-containing protein [Kordia aestuariivivens]MBC8757456.1 BNR-4 repeat-containing protein [Kordia aestuariivivens]